MDATLSQDITPLVTRWTVRPAAPPKEVAQLSRDLHVPPLLASILYARGFRDASTSWLQPPLALTPPARNASLLAKRRLNPNAIP